MNGEGFFAPMRMGMRSSVSITAEMLAALLETPALHALLDSFSEALIVCDGDSRVRFLNLAAERINRVSRQDVLGLSDSDFFQRSALQFDDYLQSVRRGGKSALTRSRDGRVFLSVVQSVPTGAYEKPYSLLIQREYEPRENVARAPQAPLADSSPSLGDPQDNSLHMSPLLSSIADMGVRAFRRRARLLLLGEPGVGKTAIARHIHRAAGWGDRPFIDVNCASIPETLFESEMFGYERGAFTGALQQGKRGYIESAAGGTLFLDEIGEIPLQVQAKMLKFLDDGTIQPVGSPLSKKVQVQVIAATNKDLKALVAAGLFRADLYYRLAVLPVDIPPLRAHRDDLPVLMDILLARINRDRQPPLRLSTACRQRLLGYDFPGNIRELVNIFERLAVLADDVAEEQHLPPELLGTGTALERDDDSAATLPAGSDDEPLKAQVQRYERQLILRAVRLCGSKRKAAQHLGIDVGTLIRKLQRD
ncbi:sigma-54 interaction domain-containing protein [Pseudomonas panipatensis]|uniref:HTH-type transcriptional regulatory protein TyrR n=1 Tax=Pseudomonas panipatensis TaxID=428992 RepID=A0A1G8J0W0_9PSED|nr:sigma 54-interacting transcriptional regulator [Pseudomonas panipatensis]SDI24844.1 Transcriptional regulator containing PAS, AAA-type ATPase, and DNA-binding Fis domains [Pseudomonas panipatensis]SMP49021.1 Transcriptional regulator containing PAS, AAA-type ATPase, and DNA-binding Fis domains [Pseudomonas panipatensis]